MKVMIAPIMATIPPFKLGINIDRRKGRMIQAKATEKKIYVMASSSLVILPSNWIS